MADRQDVSLAEPPDLATKLASFPEVELEPEQTLFRVVHRGFGPWWFSSSRAGRFDLSEPHGTCYLAKDALSALLEVIGPERDRSIAAVDLDNRVIHRLRLPATRRAADTTSRRAASFGITAELGTLVPYALPQRWASRLHAAGFRALIYWLRHDPGGSKGVALFGRAGERDEWPRGEAQKISGDLVERLRSEYGIQVLRIPRSDQLRFVAE